MTPRPKPQYHEGQRVRLIAMPKDPCPIPVGAEGTVERSNVHPHNDGWREQVWVKWDNGRSLMPSVPPDELEVL